MHSICMAILQQGTLDESLAGLSEAEGKFTREIGVLGRRFVQCVQQPHILWSDTRWTSQKAHDTAARGIMKVRSDDRVASAYFRPGLYLELFCKEVPGATLEVQAGAAPTLEVVCHGLVDHRDLEGWRERLAERATSLERPAGLLGLRTYYNYCCPSEFVGFHAWSGEDAYGRGRLRDGRSLEEHLYVGARRSGLASYVQFECRPLDVTARPASGARPRQLPGQMDLAGPDHLEEA